MKTIPTIGVVSQSIATRSDLLQQLENLLQGMKIKIIASNPTPESIALFLGECDGAIVGRETISPSTLREAGRLKVISLYGVGHDNIDLSALEEAGIAFKQTPGVNARYAAELTLGLAINLCRRISIGDARLKNQVWERDGGESLCAKSVAIMGCGHVGSQAARWFHALGAKVLIHDILPKEAIAAELDAEIVDFASALNADIVSLHLPLTQDTRHLINAQAFKKMRSGAILINTARGEIIEENALLSALEHTLSGAALDVWANEPHINQRLAQHPQVLGTAHIGGGSKQAREAMLRAAALGMQEYFNNL